MTANRRSSWQQRKIVNVTKRKEFKNKEKVTVFAEEKVLKNYVLSKNIGFVNMMTTNIKVNKTD